MTFKPFIKDNNKPRYVHKKLNHPQTVIRNIPEGINKRLKQNSAYEELFKAAIPIYQEAFKDAGYDFELT